MTCYSLDGLTPVVDPSAYIHPSAVLIGDVIVGPHCYIGPLASLRGDFGRIVLEEGANLQDTCVMHGFPDSDTVVERNGHIGHGRSNRVFFSGIFFRLIGFGENFFSRDHGRILKCDRFGTSSSRVVCLVRLL